MATHVYNKFKRPKILDIVIKGDSKFVPDQALTIAEIFERARIGVLSDVRTLKEIPDDMEEYYEDLTDGLEPLPDDDIDA